MDILQTLEGKWEDGTRPKDLFAQHIVSAPKKFLPQIVAGLSSDKRRVQSGCAELAALLSEAHPELLLPHLDLFVQNLNAKEPMLRWEAVCALGNLAAHDQSKVIAKQINTMAPLLHDRSIVLAGHTLRALAKIAQANPRLAKKVLDQIMDALDNFTDNKVGFVVEQMARFKDIKSQRDRARDFVEQHLHSKVPVVAKKAKKTLKLFA